jgi:hypothetical protein
MLDDNNVSELAMVVVANQTFSHMFSFFLPFLGRSPRNGKKKENM